MVKRFEVSIALVSGRITVVDTVEETAFELDGAEAVRLIGLLQNGVAVLGEYGE